MRSDWQNDYLALLGIEREVPSLDYLRRLTRAHLLRVPFENITSILRRAAAGDAPVPPLDPEAELQSWLRHQGGGLCFEVVEMFGGLLGSLGFQTQPVLATISFVGSHSAILVQVDGGRYLVDVGNGAPFFAPIPLDESDSPVQVHRSTLRYRFRPAPSDSGSGADAWIQDRQIEGVWQPFCTYDLAPPSTSDRHVAYQRHHRLGQSWVVDTLTLIRCTEAEVWSLRDDRLTHFTSSGKGVTMLETPEAVRHAVADIFDLPAAPIEQAQSILGQRLGTP